jgi:hypothetical protein
MSTYFLTTFAPKKWTIKRIDKIRRGSRAWKGGENASGSHCLVRWAGLLLSVRKNLGVWEFLTMFQLCYAIKVVVA